jgi:uncharacterized protein (DUF4415 family)
MPYSKESKTDVIMGKREWWLLAPSKVGFFQWFLPGVETPAGSYRRERPILVKKPSMKNTSGAPEKPRRIDWSRFDRLTDDKIESAVGDDPDAPPILDEEWFATATLVLPQPKEQISIRLDRDVLEYFRRYPRYQTRINAILRAAMEHEKRAGRLDASLTAPQTAAKRS